jgi:hypothetical protein
VNRQRIDGACYAYSKNDGTAYALPRSEYAILLAHWMAGRAFYTGLSFYGGTITLKLGDIVAVSDAPPASLLDGRADQRANEEEDRADELLSGA